jgi:segregation and condensation protein B
MTDTIQRTLEAIFFATPTPLTLEELRTHMGEMPADAPKLNLKAAVLALQEDYAKRGVNLVERGGRWHFQTAPDLGFILRREREQPKRLSKAAIETLAIIAYHEPVSRAEVEAIRGVQTSSGTLDVLMEAGWVAPAGRRETPGRPLIYATTADFLAHFGLQSRRDLPSLEDLRAAGLLDPVSDDMLEMHLNAHGQAGDELDEQEALL